MAEYIGGIIQFLEPPKIIAIQIKRKVATSNPTVVKEIQKTENIANKAISPIKVLVSLEGSDLLLNNINKQKLNASIPAGTIMIKLNKEVDAFSALQFKNTAIALIITNSTKWENDIRRIGEQYIKFEDKD